MEPISECIMINDQIPLVNHNRISIYICDSSTDSLNIVFEKVLASHRFNFGTDIDPFKSPNSCLMKRNLFVFVILALTV